MQLFKFLKNDKVYIIFNITKNKNNIRLNMPF